MWGAPEEPPDEMEGVGPTEGALDSAAVSAKETCEDNKSQLETFKEIMLKNQKDLKKKEEEVQEYAKTLSKIKSRAKLSRRSKDGSSSSTDTTPKLRPGSGLGLVEAAEDTVDDISQARTPKAKSSLLQRKLAENRKIFEQRSKEMTESKRAVEEKVEAIKQQMDERDQTIVEAHKDQLIVTPVRPLLISPQMVLPHVLQSEQLKEKDNKITELGNRILELEATIIDLQDNLKEKDSVIDSKTKAVTLMSADLSKKGKTTLDTLEDTKDEMRTMQENFVLLETSLKGKNENLLTQLQERNDRVNELEETVNRYEQEMEEKRLAESASASLSRSTMDTLVDTKDAMKSMQENFILIETSLKDKIDHLLLQLQDRETKLAESEERIYKLESGAGIVAAPEIPDLQYKIDRLELSNRALQDEKYELQKSIAELQEKIIARDSSNGNGLIVEKDNRIAELENLIEELKSSNQLLEEESKAELQKQVVELTTKNEDFANKIDDLERLNNDLEIEKNELKTKIPDESAALKEDTLVRKLTKELDDLNKAMIKLKAQHKGKLRNLQKQLDSFKMVSDANAELVKLGNQVALLEEEKGNLQLSLVDFDELKASAGDWQDRITDLESKVTTQAGDIQSHIDAIAILENQKLDLMQELHMAKQEISALEAENAESENLRVTAEMKVVDLEEQLESSHKLQKENDTIKPITESEHAELLNRIANLLQENSELAQKVAKFDEKPSSEAGSTESFETIHEDKNELLKRIEILSTRNGELEEKLAKLEEGARSNVGSTESFETINDTDKSELIKKIDALSRENSDLVLKLSKFEEKGSSDTGSTESFERIPEHGDTSSRIEFLTRENNELIIKLTKLEEKFENLLSRQTESLQKITEVTSPVESHDVDEKVEILVRENNDLVIELTKLQEKFSAAEEDKHTLRKRLEDSETRNETVVSEDSPEQPDMEIFKSRIDTLTTENNDLIIKIVKLEEKNAQLKDNLQALTETEAETMRIREKESAALSGQAITVAALENDIDECKKLIAEQTALIDEMKTKLTEKETELEGKIELINTFEATGSSVEMLQRELNESFNVVEEWKFKCTEMEQKMKILEEGKISIEAKIEALLLDNELLHEQAKQKDAAANALSQELHDTVASFKAQLQEEQDLVAKKEEDISALQEIVKSKEQELHDKYMVLQSEMITIDNLQDELNSYKTQLQQNQTTITSLNEEIRKLNDVVNSSKEETSVVQAEVIVLREELQSKAKKEARNEELSRLVIEKEVLADEMKTTLNEQLMENERLRTLLDSVNEDVESLRTNLAEKENEVASLSESKLTLEDTLRDLSAAKDSADEQFQSLQNNLYDNIKYTDGLKAELNDAYKMLELLKAKHTEDIELQNRRLQDLVELLNTQTLECQNLRAELDEKTQLVQDLNDRTSKFEIVRAELEEKEKLVGQNITEAVKIALELRVTELEHKLEESEANTQTQLQKRKILAANLKKKSIQCEELEAKAAKFEAKVADLEPKGAEIEAKATDLEKKVLELEEKWSLEKSEKEATNLRIQEIESIVKEKDDTILKLEDQLHTAQSETAEAMQKIEVLSSELHNSTEKINVLMEQVNEMGEEIEKLREEIELKSAEIQSEKNSKEKTIADYESCQRKVRDEENQRQQVLEEAKEKARELGVRMQVMEAEYVEQLNTIQTLRTENGMLVSKQAHINERLENAEKESAEQKILLDQMQRETATRESENLQQQEQAVIPVDSRTDVDGKATTSQPCDQCDQCQTVVQALEAKLQERDAEIENLDNELANSIGNFVHMRESLRVSDLMNPSSSRNRSLDESRESGDLVFQYNALTASNAEIRDKLNATLQENQELKEKIVSLQELNVALQERTGAVEEELIEGREATTRLHAVDALHTELVQKCERQENELQDTRAELEVIKQRHEEWMTGMRSQVIQLESDNSELTNNCDALVKSKERIEGEMSSIREEADHCQRRIVELEAEVDKYKQENAKLIDKDTKHTEPISAASAFFDEKYDSPQLFDAAKVFGLPAVSDVNTQKEIADLRNILTTKEHDNIQLSTEINRLREQIASQQMQEERTNIYNSEQLEAALTNCQRLQNELTQVQHMLDERNRQIDALNVELNNVGVQLSAQFSQQDNNDRLESTIATLKMEYDEISNRLNDREGTIERLNAKNTELTEKWTNLQQENLDCQKIVEFIYSAIVNVADLNSNKLSEIAIDAVPSAIQSNVIAMLNIVDALKHETNDLVALQESYKQRILTLEKEIENSSDASRVLELEERVDKIIRERDIKQLQVNELTLALEELKESMDKLSSNDETRVRNFEAALNEALAERDQLKAQVEDLTHKQANVVKSTESVETQEAQSSHQASVKLDAEPGWDDDTKLDVDEEIWSWNPEEAQHAEDHGLLNAGPLLPSLEIKLNTRIAELEDKIKDLEGERDKIVDELKTAQIRSGKLVKKLKEFKIQNESLQQQLKIQKASGGFCDLDSAIEDELKSQVAGLEKVLNESKDDHKKLIAERDNLTKRIDVLTAANERLIEMKERQDMDVEVLRIRNNELTNKLQYLERQFKDACGDESEAAINSVVSPAAESRIDDRQVESVQTSAVSRTLESGASSAVVECLCKKYREDIDELRDEIEALGAENEQLQKLLEEHKNTRLSAESKLMDEVAVREKEIEDLKRRNSEIENNIADLLHRNTAIENDLEKMRNMYQASIEHSDEITKNADAQIATMKQNYSILQAELEEKTLSFEAQAEKLRSEILSAGSQISTLQDHLQNIVYEKEELIGKTRSHEETKEKLSALTDSLTEVTDLLNARVQEVAELKQEMQKLKVDKTEALDTVQGLAQNHSRELIEKQVEAEQYVQQCETRLSEMNIEILSLQDKLTEADAEHTANTVHVQNLRDEIERLNNALTESKLHRESLQSELTNKEQALFMNEEQVRTYSLEIERLNEIIVHVQKSSADSIEEYNKKIREIEERENSLKKTIDELTARESDVLAQMSRDITDKDGRIAMLQQTVTNLEQKLHDIATSGINEKVTDVPQMIDGSASHKITEGYIHELQINLEQLKAELISKNEDIEDYKYQLSESTYPAIIQALQDQVNLLYEEKTQIEASVATAAENLNTERVRNEHLVENLRQQSHYQSQLQNELDQLRKQTSTSKNDDSTAEICNAKDSEIQQLKIELEEKGARFRDLHDHYEIAEVQINELRLQLASKDEEINVLQRQLAMTSKECEFLQRALPKDIPSSETEIIQRSESSAVSSTDVTKEQSSNELDLALYMLHQRDIRCEELTHELVQLLEERDTLQLRLSNAIRINEELRRSLPPEAQRSNDALENNANIEPVVEEPSPSRSVGPVEIAKEALDSPTDEKIVLAQKLSQLHNTGHRRDVRLLDDRDLRHNQQMSLLAHRDVLNTLPPEAAARLVNANYTLSRDVQSQSSVLLNWLWGKSTPKVVHM